MSGVVGVKMGGLVGLVGDVQDQYVNRRGRQRAVDHEHT